MAIFGDFVRPVFLASRMQHVSDMHPIALRPHHVVDIQSPTAENRRGQKDRKKKEETTGQKYNVRICYAWLP